MTVWRSRGLRGDALEELIHNTNDYYRQKHLGRIDKISTPIKVVEIDSSKVITRAFFEKKSTVDFMGIIQGVGIAFDAKETNLKSLPLSNIHEHQVEFMKDIDHQNGLAFMIIHFKFCDEYYLFPYEEIKYYYDHRDSRKSIPYSAMIKEFIIKISPIGILDYLPALNAYLDYKDKKDSK